MIDDRVAFIMMKLGHLAAQRDRDAYLRGLVELCSQATEAERATVFLVNHKRKELWAKIAQRTTVEIRLPIGRGPNSAFTFGRSNHLFPCGLPWNDPFTRCLSELVPFQKPNHFEAADPRQLTQSPGEKDPSRVNARPRAR